MKHITLKLSVIILLIINSFSSSAQLPDTLPKGLTDLERELIPQFQFTGNRVMSDPPLVLLELLQNGKKLNI